MTIPVVARVARRGRRAAYDRVGTNDDEDIDDDRHVSSTTTTAIAASTDSDNDQLLNPSDQQGQEQHQQGRTDVAGGSGDDDSPTNSNNTGEYINLVVLDTAQTKFAIPNVQSDWTIGKLKKVGSKIHKVSPAYQRLIYRGQMLQDEKTLKDYGIMSQKQLQQDLETLEAPSLNTKSKKKKRKKKDNKKGDDTAVEEANLEFIVHLFPKPRVVVVDETNDETDGLKKKKKKMASSGNDTDGNTTTDGDDEEAGTGGGAHIPQIILNAQEAQQRGTILVLGSAEIGEAQNNVKFLSLLLLFVCSMRLLALASIATAPDSTTPPPDGYNNFTNHSSHHYHHHMNTTSNSNNAMMGPSSYYDDGEFGPSPNGGDMDYSLGGGAGGGAGGYQDEPTRPWQTSDWFDLTVSVIGFYVATLGLKATTENTLKLATSYLAGVFITGILWNIWNIFVYAVFVRDETQWDHNASNDDGKDDHSGGGGGGSGLDPSGGSDDDDEVITLSLDDYVTVAFFMVAMPMMVWVWCCVRAYQFRHLIQEAEQDAAERRLATSNVGNEQHHSDDEEDDEEEQHETEDGVAESGDDGHHRLIV